MERSRKPFASSTAAAEWKRLGDLHCLIEADKVWMIVKAMLQAAKDTIQDPELYRRANARLLEYLPPAERR